MLPAVTEAEIEVLRNIAAGRQGAGYHYNPKTAMSDDDAWPHTRAGIRAVLALLSKGEEPYKHEAADDLKENEIIE